MKNLIPLSLGFIFLVGFAPLTDAQQYRTKEGIKQHAEERRRQEEQRAEQRKTEVLDRSNVGVNRRQQTEQLNRIDQERERRTEVINRAEKEALQKAAEREKQAKEKGSKTRNK